MTEQRVLNDRFRLVCQLGEGGMGSVWLAEDTWLERPVALKELRQPRDSGIELTELRQRVLQEARALARVRHPAIVSVHDLFFTGADPWIVMDYVSGRSLDKIIAERRLEEREVARIGLHVLRGLVAVHRAGIVHRDVKPANILVGDDGSVYLVDFGIAKIDGDPSLTGVRIIGTVEYLSPERLRPGSRGGPPADIWGLGATFFQALVGHSPFRSHPGQGPDSIMTAIAQEAPALTSVSPLSDITLRMLAKDPAQRATAKEVYDVLARVAAKSQPTSPLPVVPRDGGKSPTAALRQERRGPGADTGRTAGQPARQRNEHPAARDGLLDQILRVGPETGAALLLGLDVSAIVKVLGECPAKRRGELLQEMAAVQPATAARLLRMMLDITAGEAFAYLKPQTAAALLSAMHDPEAARILASTDARAAASAIRELPTAHAVTLLKGLQDAQRAAEILTYATSPVALAVVCVDPGFGAVLLSHLPGQLRLQARHALSLTGVTPN